MEFISRLTWVGRWKGSQIQWIPLDRWCCWESSCWGSDEMALRYASSERKGSTNRLTLKWSTVFPRVSAGRLGHVLLTDSFFFVLHRFTTLSVSITFFGITIAGSTDSLVSIQIHIMYWWEFRTMLLVNKKSATLGGAPKTCKLAVADWKKVDKKERK